MKVNGNGQAGVLTVEGTGIKSVSTHSFRRKVSDQQVYNAALTLNF
jgi:hypothetical protein